MGIGEVDGQAWSSHLSEQPTGGTPSDLQPSPLSPHSGQCPSLRTLCICFSLPHAPRCCMGGVQQQHSRHWFSVLTTELVLLLGFLLHSSQRLPPVDLQSMHLEVPSHSRLWLQVSDDSLSLQNSFHLNLPLPGVVPTSQGH